MLPEVVYRAVLPALAAVLVATVLVKRAIVARGTGRDPIRIRPWRELHTPHAFLELIVSAGGLLLLADVALNALAPATVARLCGVAALRRSETGGAAGLGLLVLGVACMVASIRAMGASWRIGIDREAPGALVTTGIYGLVRHPIYTGMLATTTGLALVTADLLSIALGAAALVGVPVQARLEEEFLLARHPSEYGPYMGRTGRFIPGIGRRRAPAT